MMLSELGPQNSTVESRVLFIGAVFFLLCGLGYKRIADYIQKTTGQSVKVKNIGVAIMPPAAIVMSILCLVFAFMLLFG